MLSKKRKKINYNRDHLHELKRCEFYIAIEIHISVNCTSFLHIFFLFDITGEKIVMWEDIPLNLITSTVLDRWDIFGTYQVILWIPLEQITWYWWNFIINLGGPYCVRMNINVLKELVSCEMPLSKFVFFATVTITINKQEEQ